MPGGPTYDQERVQVNIARLKKGGETFEIVIDADLAVAYKEKGGEAEQIRELLKAEKIFSDGKKGLLASEIHMQTTFGTEDPLAVAKVILEEGEIQITQEHRERIREAKRKSLVHMIHLNAIDPRTNNPHPEKRIELAMDEAKVKIDEFRKAEDQVQDVVDKLKPLLPIRYEQVKLQLHLPAETAAKLFSTVQHYATILKDEWLNDGSWKCTIEMPAGMRGQLLDELNSKAHGSITAEIIK